MAGTCKEFGFHFAQSRAPPGRDLELSKLRPREPSRVRTPHAVGGWAPGLCGLGHVLSSEPVLASHASRCGLVCQACRWTDTARRHREAAERGPRRGRGRVLGWPASRRGYHAQGKATTF